MKNEFWSEDKKRRASIGFDVNTKNIASLQIFEKDKYDRDEYNGDSDAEYKFKPNAQGVKEAEELGMALFKWAHHVSGKTLIQYTDTISKSVKQLKNHLNLIGMKAAVGMDSQTLALIVWVRQSEKEAALFQIPPRWNGYPVRIKHTSI
jgi:hypothetical protein